MANRRVTTELKTEQDFYSDTYTGGRRELIEAGVIREGQFPGDPGNGTVMCTYLDGQPTRKPTQAEMYSAGYMKVTRMSHDRFRVILGLTPSERFRRDREEEKIAAEAQRLRFGPQAYVRASEDLVLVLWRMVIGGGRDRNFPYPFTIATGPDNDRMQAILREALSIVRRAKLAETEVPPFGLDHARGDQKFQAFLTLQGLRDQPA